MLPKSQVVAMPPDQTNMVPSLVVSLMQPLVEAVLDILLVMQNILNPLLYSFPHKAAHPPNMEVQVLMNLAARGIFQEVLIKVEKAAAQANG